MAGARAGAVWGEGSPDHAARVRSLGIFFHLAESRERAVREITPWYEEHVKMFGPLGLVPGLTPEQDAAAMRRGGWAAAGVPTVEHYAKVGARYAGPPEEFAAYLRSLEQLDWRRSRPVRPGTTRSTCSS